MITFFGNSTQQIFAVASTDPLSTNILQKLSWLFAEAPAIDAKQVAGTFVGPRAAMISPWSTNAVEITQNMDIQGILRIEKYQPWDAEGNFDPMLMQKFEGLDQDLFDIKHEPAPILEIKDIAGFNQTEGLALSEEEIQYLEELSEKLGRKLTDSEVFGFSQVNSEHCRHKIFNGTFVVDGEEKPHSLFQLIKQTSKEHPNQIVSAYRDNVAFLQGPKLQQFAPDQIERPGHYQKNEFESVLSLKAETHNFPTTVEPFNGAATGSGGEIRDRLAGGQGSIPLAGTAVYMTAYSRLKEGRNWEKAMQARPWLYQTPLDILIKASNGASDFGNKFGQPLIAGSLFTFEHEEAERKLGFDKVIMLAGGIGYGKKDRAHKRTPKAGDKIVVMGGDNYRIGMGGAAVSSADTGEYSSGIELNAVQRSNPEMQKRVANAIRAVVESGSDLIISIHDHGAGGHLNCLSELVEEVGGKIQLDALPIGDPTLSAKEIIGNESQERMGLIVAPEDLPILQQVAARERAPLYVVGEVSGDHRFSFVDQASGDAPMDLALADMFGSSPKTIMDDQKLDRPFQALDYQVEAWQDYLGSVLRLEAVACKDWLTNKVDRCVGGLVAKQQCAGPLQLPLNNCGVMALDFEGVHGLATSIGHSPISGLIDPVAGSRNSIAEALTNLVWAPLSEGLASVSLSANWMWPCRNPGEDARLYEAVEAASEFARALGINIPTGKDSLSMKQKYGGEEVLSPGTVVISAAGHCEDITRVVEPVLQADGGKIYYLDLSQDARKLGGSSLGQVLNRVGHEAPTVQDPVYFAQAFNLLQDLIKEGQLAAGHDISSGGLITALLEMCFSDPEIGAEVSLDQLGGGDLIQLLFAENAGVLIQGKDDSLPQRFEAAGLSLLPLGQVNQRGKLSLSFGQETWTLEISDWRDAWYETSYLLDQHQSGQAKAQERFDQYKQQPLRFQFPADFNGQVPIRKQGVKRPLAAVLREKGSNSERELAHALYLAGFEVRDVHMTDLISGRETLEDVQFLGAVGGFSNSDVLGSAKGWAGSFLYNEKARRSLENFFAREDVLSIGICNGCQLFIELNLINPDHPQPAKMLHNETHKHESAFTSVSIPENNSVMLGSLAGSTLGVWISHGEGKFHLPMPEDQYHVVAQYGYAAYPANPNGSDYNVAMLASQDGRHLVTMPHIERSMFRWNWAHYPAGREDVISPWVQAFVNAREWLEGR